MAETAFQTQFRQEMIATFEQRQSLLRDMTTTEAVVKGNTATFLVAGSGGATAVTRGVNGKIPTRANDLTQTSVTLVEWHDVPTVSGFNIFASQGDLRSLLQKESVGVINRKIDSDIITELNTATNDTGTASTASMSMAVRALTILQNNKVPSDGAINAVISPAFNAYLLQDASYASSDYVDLKPMVDPNAWADRPKARRWLDVNWMVHPELPGAGTSAEKCFMFHRSAVGHAMNTGGLMTAVGYEDEQDYSYARCSCYMGTQNLQNSGIVVMNHDGSALVAE